MLDYFGSQLAERRRAPRDDLVSALLTARDRDDRMSEDELLAMIIQLVFAGHETTVQQIGATVTEARRLLDISWQQPARGFRYLLY